MQYIYKITFPNNQLYIGRSKNYKNRWKKHIWLSKKEGRKNIVHSAMKHFGIENLKFEVIEETTNDLVFEREIYWIAFYKSNQKGFGYNVSKGGKDLWYGLKKDFSEEQWNELQRRIRETKQKNGINYKGENNPMSLQSIAKRNRCSIEEASKLTPIYGKERSQKVKDAAKKTHTGKFVSDETKNKWRSSRCKKEYIIINKVTGLELIGNSLSELAVNLGFKKTDFYSKLNNDKLKSYKTSNEELNNWKVYELETYRNNEGERQK